MHERLCSSGDLDGGAGSLPFLVSTASSSFTANALAQEQRGGFEAPTLISAGEMGAF